MDNHGWTHGDHTRLMDNLQLNMKAESLLPTLSPGIIDVSSDSGDEFVVQSVDVSILEDR